MTKTILKQIIGPVQQWLLEEGKCVSCGKELLSKGGIVNCPCGQTYLYMPKANLYKRLTANKYAQS